MFSHHTLVSTKMRVILPLRINLSHLNSLKSLRRRDLKLERLCSLSKNFKVKILKLSKKNMDIITMALLIVFVKSSIKNRKLTKEVEVTNPAKSTSLNLVDKNIVTSIKSKVCSRTFWAEILITSLCLRSKPSWSESCSLIMTKNNKNWRISNILLSMSTHPMWILVASLLSEMMEPERISVLLNASTIWKTKFLFEIVYHYYSYSFTDFHMRTHEESIFLRN